MVARLANADKALHPRLIESIGGVEQPSGALADELPFAKDHIHFVRDAMASVTETGTAAATAQLGLGSIKMAGKTGTAQAHTYRAGERTSRTLPWERRDHAWFVAFAPYDDPRYAISVLVEHGGFGASAAAPRAREIMRVALLKDPELRSRIEQPTPMPVIPDQPAEGAVARSRRRLLRARPRQCPVQQALHDRQRPDPSRRTGPSVRQVRRD